MAKPPKYFKMPSHYSVTSLSTSLTKAFVMAILPRVTPTDADIEEALQALAMVDKPVCAYCGDKQTQWDHLRPVVTDSMPTGYISEIQNLVPCCGPCNSSKGAKDWRLWITSGAKGSPATRRVRDLQERIVRLEAYEGWRRPTVVDFSEILGPEEWARYWEDWAKIKAALADAQPRATVFKPLLQQSVTPGSAATGAPSSMAYVVRSPTAVTAPLPKRRAMLAMVTEAAGLVGCVEVREVVGESAFRCVPGTLAGEELWAALALEYGLAEKHRKEWFLEAPIIEGRSTWVLRANVWGKKTESTFEALADLTAGKVTASLDVP